MTAIVTGAVDPVVFRSPDRLVRLGLTLCTAVLATGPLLAAAVVTRGSGVLAMIVLLLAAAAVVGARIAQEGCTVDADGLTDRRTFRSRSYRWDDVAAVAVDRAPGGRRGLCVWVHPRRGPVVDVRGTWQPAVPLGAPPLADVVAVIERRLAAGSTRRAA